MLKPSIDEIKCKEFASGKEVIAAALALRNKFRPPIECVKLPSTRLTLDKPASLVVDWQEPDRRSSKHQNDASLCSDIFGPVPVGSAPELVKDINYYKHFSRNRLSYTLRSITKRVAWNFGVPLEKLFQNFGTGQRGSPYARELSRIRQLAMSLGHELSDSTLPVTGMFFRCDHTTVMHSKALTKPVFDFVAMCQGTPHILCDERSIDFACVVAQQGDLSDRPTACWKQSVERFRRAALL